MGLVSVGEQVTQGVGSSERYLEFCLSENVCDIQGLFAYVCETGPFLCLAGGDLFPCVVGRGFVWVYGKGIIV